MKDIIWIAVLIVGLMYTCASYDNRVDKCESAGGVWHCSARACDCYTPDGRVMLPASGGAKWQVMNSCANW